MTTQDIIDYYANLLILQYKGKPNAYATIQAAVTPIIMDQLPDQVQNAFEIGTAVGVQLDILGKYVGVTRTGNGFTGPITLDDADFATLITLAIFQNNAGSSLAQIQQLIANFFAGQMFVFDFKDMSMGYYINSSIGTLDLIELFITENLLPKPMGVALKATIVGPVIDNFFGFRTYQLPAANSSPFNTYSDYQSGRPWLSYSNAVIPP